MSNLCKNRIAIICQDIDFAFDSTAYDVFIGVERGCLWLMAQGLCIHKAIGDFDSVSAQELEQIQAYATDFEKHPIQKDLLDGELALQYAQGLPGDNAITIVAGGSNYDMILAMTGLLHHYSATLINASNHIFTRSLGLHTLKPIGPFTYISFIALEEALVDIAGLAYEAKHLKMSVLGAEGMRNAFLESEAFLRVHQGKIMVFYS